MRTSNVVSSALLLLLVTTVGCAKHATKPSAATVTLTGATSDTARSSSAPQAAEAPAAAANAAKAPATRAGQPAAAAAAHGPDLRAAQAPAAAAPDSTPSATAALPAAPVVVASGPDTDTACPAACSNTSSIDPSCVEGCTIQNAKERGSPVHLNVGAPKHWHRATSLAERAAESASVAADNARARKPAGAQCFIPDECDSRKCIKPSDDHARAAAHNQGVCGR